MNTKSTVREQAIQHRLPNAGKKDSQGICFLGDVKINQFLEHYIEDSSKYKVPCQSLKLQIKKISCLSVPITWFGLL